MILWILRFFPEFRQVERERDSMRTDLVFIRAAHQERVTDNLRLQDRTDAAEAERTRVWKLLEESLENERLAYRMQVNEDWQRRYGVTPHPDAPHIPATQEHHAEKVGAFGRQGRVLPSEYAANYEREFWKARRTNIENATTAVE